MMIESISSLFKIRGVADVKKSKNEKKNSQLDSDTTTFIPLTHVQNRLPLTAMGEKRDVGENITLPLMKRQPGFYESFVRIRVTHSNADMLGLTDPNIIRIGKVEWIRENSIYNSYLFFISSLLFDVSDVSILRTRYGRDDMDGATTWEKINPDEEIAGGVYLLQLSGILTQDLFLC
jgi:hypothetical protein